MINTQVNTPEVDISFPFGEPDPDAVSIASGIFRAVSGYEEAVASGVGVAEDPDVIQETRDVAAFRFNRARFGSMRCTTTADEDLLIKYARVCEARAEAETGAYVPIRAVPEELSPGEVRRIIQEGEELALLDVWEQTRRDKARFASQREFSEEQRVVVRASLEHAFVASSEDWQREELMWLADEYGFYELRDRFAEQRYPIDEQPPAPGVALASALVQAGRRLFSSLAQIVPVSVDGR